MLVVPTCTMYWLFMTVGVLWANPVSAWSEGQRLAIHDPQLQLLQRDVAAFVREHSKPREKVLVIFPFGHLIAQNAGVQNLYPYAHTESLVVQPQLDELLELIEKQRIHKIFGSIPDELTEALADRAFKRSFERTTDPSMRPLLRRLLKVHRKAFDYWTDERPARRAKRSVTK
jgi:hypothetical protein